MASTIDPRAPEPTVRRHARRASVAVAGGTTVLVGIVLLPLPGPGTLVILGGLSILGREFPKARRTVDLAKRVVETGAERSRAVMERRRERRDQAGDGAERSDR